MWERSLKQPRGELGESGQIYEVKIKGEVFHSGL